MLYYKPFLRYLCLSVECNYTKNQPPLRRGVHKNNKKKIPREAKEAEKHQHFSLGCVFRLLLLEDTSLPPTWCKVTLPTYSSLYSISHIPRHALVLSHIPNIYTCPHICIYTYVCVFKITKITEVKELSEEPPCTCDI